MAFPKLTVDRIQYCLSTRFTNRFEIMSPNAYIGSFELDFVGVRRSGFVDEFEIKMSRPDFLADFRKSSDEGEKHLLLMSGKLVTNNFTFVCPTDLIKPDEIPEQYGLIYVSPKGGILEVRRPKRLHERKITAHQRERIYMKLYYRWWDNYRKLHNQK